MLVNFRLSTVTCILFSIDYKSIALLQKTICIGVSTSKPKNLVIFTENRHLLPPVFAIKIYSL